MLTYQLKLSLKGIKPLIWRRILTPANISLSSFHELLQIVMQWNNYHLHEFVFEGMHFGTPSDDDDNFDFLSPELNNYSDLCVDSFLQVKKEKFKYIYDYGDFWEVNIVLEEIIPDSRIKKPQLLAGKMAAPPEDCGGTLGFEDLVRILSDPSDPEHERMVEWSGDFDPKALNIDEINSMLDCRKFKYLRQKSPKQIKAEEDRIKRVHELIIQFCDEKLIDGYKKMCLRLFDDLEDAELLKGRAKAHIWACAIVQAVGEVNFLFNPKTKPHLPLNQLYEWFGVEESMVFAKLSIINKEMDMTPFVGDYGINNDVKYGFTDKEFNEILLNYKKQNTKFASKYKFAFETDPE